MKKIFKFIVTKIGLYNKLQPFYRYKLLTLYYRIIYKKYKGDGFLCNFCGSRYKYFIPNYPPLNDEKALKKNNVIAGYGDNVYCPNCFSNSRERLIKEILVTSFNTNINQILFIAPEKHLFDFIKSKAQVIIADLQPDNYKRIDNSIIFADVTNLSFNDNTFDLIIANHIMEHIPDDLKAMSEIFRVLKKGGYAILQIPFSISLQNTIEDPKISNPKKQSALFGQKDHVRIYHLDDYIKRLKQSGFKVEYLTYDSLRNLYKYAIQPNEGFISIQK